MISTSPTCVRSFWGMSHSAVYPTRQSSVAKTRWGISIPPGLVLEVSESGDSVSNREGLWADILAPYPATFDSNSIAIRISHILRAEPGQACTERLQTSKSPPGESCCYRDSTTPATNCSSRSLHGWWNYRPSSGGKSIIETMNCGPNDGLKECRCLSDQCYGGAINTAYVLTAPRNGCIRYPIDESQDNTNGQQHWIQDW